jgi:hypothetical protein
MTIEFSWLCEVCEEAPATRWARYIKAQVCEACASTEPSPDDLWPDRPSDRELQRLLPPAEDHPDET